MGFSGEGPFWAKGYLPRSLTRKTFLTSNHEHVTGGEQPPLQRPFQVGFRFSRKALIPS